MEDLRSISAQVSISIISNPQLNFLLAYITCLHPFTLHRFFEAYRADGLDFWGMTIQNEPMTGFQEVRVEHIKQIHHLVFKDFEPY